MFRVKEESSFQEGNGYKINNVPLDINYNACNVKYTLNNDFSKNPYAKHNDSTNKQARSQRLNPQGAGSGHHTFASGNAWRMSGEQTADRANARTTYAQRNMGSQTAPQGARPVAKKASPIGLLILPIIFVLIVIFMATGKNPGSLIWIVAAIAAIFSSKNKKNTRR